jgi:hypothetical protein
MHRNDQRRAAEHLIRAYAIMNGVPVDEERLARLIEELDFTTGFAIEMACAEVGTTLRVMGIEPTTYVYGDIDLVREVSIF